MKVVAVIPVYQQSQYLVESVSSALAQHDVDIRVVIVNDGCPHEATHEIGQALQHAHPGRVVYFRQRNGGLSAARNAGIEAALLCWPGIEAVFPLDADNRLSPTTLAELCDALGDDRAVGWASPALEAFGNDHFVWRPSDPFSTYRQRFENQCDAGSLIRRDLFDRGLRYQESMRHGYEDWEFFIRAGTHGFHGVHAGCRGFRYRRRRESLLTVATARHDEIVRQMRHLNPQSFLPKEILRLEDRELPRFAWFDPAHRCWFRGSTARSLLSSPPRELPLGTEPILIAATRAVLVRVGVHLAGILLRGQASLRRNDHYALQVADLEATGSRLRQLESGDAGPVHLVMAPWHRADSLHELSGARGESGGPLERLELEPEGTGSLTGSDELTSARLSDIRLESAAGTPSSVRHGSAVALERHFQEGLAEQRPHRRHHEWAFERHVANLDTLFPFEPTTGNDRTLAFVMPWLALGGVDHCVVQLAAAIRRLRPTWQIHLILTVRGDTWGDRSKLTVFDSITSVAGLAHGDDVTALAAAVMTSDVVVNAHSGEAFECLALLRDRVPKPHYVCYSHVLDQDDFGLPLGWPEMAALLDPAIDTHLVISDRLRLYCESNGVPREKLFVARNAPVVAPSSKERALEITAERQHRLESGGPIRLLFAGRLDRQKGLARLTVLAELLSELGDAVEFTVVGDKLISDEVFEFPSFVVRRSAVSNASVLSEVFASHDVIVLSSLWEGVPLALLDAMAHGMVPITTNVGAISEVIVHDESGYLVGSDASDSAIAAEMERMVKTLHSSPATFSAMSKHAMEVASSHSWDTTALHLVDLAEAQ